MNHSEPPSSPRSKDLKVSTDSIGDKNLAQENKKSEKDASKKRIVKWISWVSACLAFCFIGFAARIYSSSPTLKSLIDGFFRDSRHPLDISGHFSVDNYFPKEKHKGLTLMFLGCDYDYKDSNTIPNKILKSNGRSDAVMLARFDFVDKTLSILSLARDTKVHIPGYGFHKLNAAHEYGGPELSRATISQDFGVTPDYYVDINFESFQQSVNALGGVDVTIHKPLKYDDNAGNLHVDLKPGFQHLNGYQAMGYVRIRHSDNDLERQKRQHEFIEALRSRISSLSGLSKVPGLLDVISKNTKSDMSNDQIVTLANFARQLPKESVHLETMPVTEGSTFVYVNPHKAEALIRKLFYKDDKIVALNVNVPDSVSSRRSASSKHRRRADVNQNEEDSSDVRVIEGERKRISKPENESSNGAESSNNMEDPNQSPDASNESDHKNPAEPQNSDRTEKPEKRDKAEKIDSGSDKKSDGPKSEDKPARNAKDGGTTTSGDNRSPVIKI